jgi:putative Mn2+ efflux pump MntP
MVFSVTACLEAFILAVTLSLDAFAAGFAYGCAGVKIPFKSVQVINLVCSAFLGISLLAGVFARRLVPPNFGMTACFLILLTIGGIKLFQSLFQKEKKTDFKAVKILKPAEAAALAAGLSLDGLAVGFGAGLGNANALVIFAVSLFSDIAAVTLGCYLGRKLSQKIKYNISWVGGAIIIILAFTKLI